MSGVEALFVIAAKGAPAIAMEAVHARAGVGLDGDQNAGSPKPEEQLTLIEGEALDGLARDHAIVLAPGAHRRNVVTRGVALNSLVGRTFRVGSVRARGLERCDPCLHLEELTRPGVLKGLVDRGGLRAEILSDGVIRPGDPVVIED